VSVVELHLATLSEVISAAIAIATGYGVWARRRLASRRALERERDAIRGWIDENGGWHLGIIDTVRGYVDESGTHHEGLEQTVQRHEEWIARQGTVSRGR